MRYLLRLPFLTPLFLLLACGGSGLDPIVGDGGPRADAGSQDAGSHDGGSSDGGSSDGGSFDGGSSDGGSSDSGVRDDGGTADAGTRTDASIASDGGTSACAETCRAPMICGAVSPTNLWGDEDVCGDPCPSRLVCADFDAPCGVVSDGCGGEIDLVADCGQPGCGGGASCQNDTRFGYRPNNLMCSAVSCTPRGCADPSLAGVTCGTIEDGCGGVIDLERDCAAPGCGPGEVCGGGVVGPNRCSAPTCTGVPRSCADFASLVAAANAAGEPLCGSVDDGCGGTLDLVADCGAPGCGACTPGAPLPRRCADRPADVAGSRVCFENASGCPGEIIGLDVHVLLPLACDEHLQASSSFELSGFALLNERTDTCGEERCIRREVFAGRHSWTQLPGSAIGCATCPNAFPAGHVDTLLVRIPPGRPAGDVELGSTRTGFIGYAGCGCPDGEGCWLEPMPDTPTVRVF